MTRTTFVWKGIPMNLEPTTEPTTEQATETDLVAEDLIEEVSIDGMCGVY
ncbi:MAG: mycofactocin precursor MftA [Nocardioides sp.]|nr:mycofactocin precursor MftA [Nocardioides sp.]